MFWNEGIRSCIRMVQLYKATGKLQRRVTSVALSSDVFPSIFCHGTIRPALLLRNGGRQSCSLLFVFTGPPVVLQISSSFAAPQQIQAVIGFWNNHVTLNRSVALVDREASTALRRCSKFCSKVWCNDPLSRVPCLFVPRRLILRPAHGGASLLLEISSQRAINFILLEVLRNATAVLICCKPSSLQKAMDCAGAQVHCNMSLY